MRRLLGLVFLAPLLAGCGCFGGWSPYPSTSSRSGTARLHPVPLPPPSVPRWVDLEHLPAKAIPGAKLFAISGCTACHTYAGTGSKNLDAPDLTAIGRRHLGISFQVQHLRSPASVTPGSPMPPFASLGKKRLRQLAVFLEASKGIH
jgi:cytochrome c553